MQDKNVEKDILLDKLSDIQAEICKHKCSDISLMEGIPGLILFLDSYYTVTKDHSLIIRRDDYLNILLDILNGANHLSLTYCDGLVGVLSFIRLFSNKHNGTLYDFDKDTDDYLFHVMFDNLSNKKFDFLHGGLGIFWHYVIRLKTSTDQAEISRLSDYLQKGLEILEYTAIKDELGYRWENSINGTGHLSGQKIYNMGLAHGQPGTLAVISNACRYLKNKIIAHRIIQESSKFILNRKRDGEMSQFPSHFCKEVAMPYNSRLAWCYGDLGVSIALNFAAKALNDASLKIASETIAINTTSRRKIITTSLFDAELCHGTAGVSHLYGILYRSSGKLLFKQAQNYWMHKTMDYSNHIDGFAGFRTHIKENEWGRDLGLLKGIAGIGLAMMAYLDCGRDWDTLLLLS